MEFAWQSLYSKLQTMSDIPDEQWTIFQKLAEPMTVKKNSCFARQGEPSNSIAFCMNGLLRLYYTTANGTTFNKSFCSSGDFVASYRALLTSSPSYFSIEALMDSELLVIRYEHFQSLFTEHICWERLGRNIVEQLYIKKEQREYELLMLSAEERYRLFLERHSHMINDIPQYHIASFLGITPVALSRIKRKINLG